MKFRTKIVNGQFYISHTEIARVVYANTLEAGQQAGGRTSIQAQNLAADIKANLLALSAAPALPKDSVIRVGFEAYADRAAFGSLVQHYGWGEDVSQPVLAALKPIKVAA